MAILFNGRRMTSGSQLQREFKKSLETAVEKKIKAAAPAGVRVRKASKGFEAEGEADAIQRMVRRLKG